MALAVLYKYINCTVDKLLALGLVTDYITNYSNNWIIIISSCCKSLKIDQFQGIV